MNLTDEQYQQAFDYWCSLQKDQQDSLAGGYQIAVPVKRVREYRSCEIAPTHTEAVAVEAYYVLAWAARKQKEELAEMNALFDLQRKRMTDAVKEWQGATGATYYPDLGQLLTWLLENRKAMIALYKAVEMYGACGKTYCAAMAKIELLKGGKK